MDPAQANIYEIYLQPEEPHACCATYLFRWMHWVELKEGRQLQEDDLLFPNLTSNDQIQPNQPFSAIQMSSLLNKYATDAGVMDRRYNRLDTHCFRRGGAQYRLTHAQDPWPFKAIKWWGGWAEREPAEEIMEYLFDDSQYEASFGDMMSPRGSKSRGHIGMAKLPAEVIMMKECFKETMRSMETRHAAALDTIEKEVRELKQQTNHIQQENTEWRGAISLQLEKVVHMLSSRVLSAATTTSTPSRADPRPVSTASVITSITTVSIAAEAPPAFNSHCKLTAPIASTKKFSGASYTAIVNWKEAIIQWNEGDPENGLENPLSEWMPRMKYGQSTFSDRKLIASEFESFRCSDTKMRQVNGGSLDRVGKLVQAIRKRHKQQGQEEEEEDEEVEDEEEDEEGVEEGVEEEGDNLPELPIPRVTHWKDVIRQWEEGDPDYGLVPLREWTMEMRQMNKLYPTRKLIAKEFERCGHNEATMRQMYGDNLDGLNTLITAIRKQNRMRRIQAKNAARPQTVNDSNTESEDDEEEKGEAGGAAGPMPRVPRLQTWKQAIEQWETGDPEQGLTPMRDWPYKWRNTARTRMLYLTRKRIAEEFAFCGRDEIRMRELHGNAMDSSNGLVKSIRKRLGLSRPRRNKGPLENTTGNEEDELDELEEEEEEEERKKH
ncbi:hypothetical protein BG006_008554 [Podila minutissima]|uniref:Uncharacterized protein n=1 Tax=Podila minutissima TaxID=64525 RepID=A0A9P5SIB7_9FUNG|nr:hypothetical protein BG006_008554 [Podila minutissima]